MNIPNFINTRMVDDKGYLTPEWSNILTQLITELQLNLSNEGYRLPLVPTLQINQLVAVEKSIGNMLYDSTTNEAKVNINGVWEVVQAV